MGELVRLEVSDGVGTIRLDRPKMNAISAQLQTELAECALEASARDDVAAVVVYGGERVFAAGADIGSSPHSRTAHVPTAPRGPGCDSAQMHTCAHGGAAPARPWWIHDCSRRLRPTDP